MGASAFAGARQRFSFLVSSLIFLSTKPSTVQADDHGVTFLFPTRGLTFHYLDVINVTYLSPFPQPNLYIFCDGGGRQVEFRPAAPYNGSVLDLLNFTSTTDCWFDLRPGTEGGHGANSQSFKLLNDARAATTVGLAQSSTTSTSTSTPNSSADPAPSSASTGATADSSGTGLSSGASAGIGVGASIGVVLIAGAAAAIWWRRRKANRAGMPLAEASSSDNDGGSSGGVTPYTYRQGTPVALAGPLENHEQKPPVMVAQHYVQRTIPTELSDANAPIEMPGESERRPELP